MQTMRILIFACGFAMPALAAEPLLAEPLVEAGSMPEVPTAAELLEQGFTDFRSNRFTAASRAFAEAITTGELNDAGRVLAYWHIHLAEHQLGHTDQSSEAVSSFIVIAEGLLAADPRPGEPARDFIERFELRRRLAQARALLSATWARRVPEFGRSQTNPIRVHSPVEVAYFLRFASDCSAATLPPEGGSERSGRRSTIERITLRCDNDLQAREYYFSYR